MDCREEAIHRFLIEPEIGIEMEKAPLSGAFSIQVQGSGGGLRIARPSHA